MPISMSASGSFDHTEAFLKKMAEGPSMFDQLSRFGEMGRSALASSTPVDSGETAASWYYEVVNDGKSWSIIWGNYHIVNGRPIAVLLQFGHGTRNGGWVEGRDFMNPALRPVLDMMTAEGWKVVTSA